MSISLTHSLTYLTLLAVVSSAIASSGNRDRLVKFPSKQILQESMHKAGFAHFVEKTKILDIVDAGLVPLGVAMRLECELYDYDEYMSQGRTAQETGLMKVMMQMRKSEMLEILLQNDAAALAELQVHGIYEPR